MIQVISARKTPAITAPQKKRTENRFCLLSIRCKALYSFFVYPTVEPRAISFGSVINV